jgi:hypothetical protein
MLHWIVKLAIIVSFGLFACSETHDVSNSSIPLAQPNIKVNQTIDTATNEIMRYIAGLPTVIYKDLQQQPYYHAQVAEIEQSWQRIAEQSIGPIKSWVEKNHIIDSSDTIPLFYPFSGPDFFYANYFFPHAKTYIMFGLEQPGNLPELNKIGSELLKNYHQNIRNAMADINALGFFATKKMAVQFQDRNLDGSLHLILFYLGRTGHEIISFSRVYIDQFGMVKEMGSLETINPKTKGIRIEIINKENQQRKTVYYLQVDISDNNLKNNTEFLHFINQFGLKNTFIKSASYLLHKDEYSLIRTNILSQSKKILQDDTGVPFYLVKNKKYQVDLYGTYTRTIDLFASRYQPQLKLAFEKNVPGRGLPFLLGYNASHNETLLMLIRPGAAPYLEQKLPVYTTELKKPGEKDSKKPASGLKHTDKEVVYKIQLRISKTEIKNYKTVFAGFPDLDFYFHNGNYKYTSGKKASRQECGQLLDLARQKGYTDAFVIAFVNGKRIALEDIGKN